MIIAGAGGHAIEILSVLSESDFQGEIYFFNDINSSPGTSLFNKYKVLTTIDEVKDIFKSDPSFVIGVGKPKARKTLSDKLSGAGGELQSVISPSAKLGKHEVILDRGLNIMTGAVITNRARIGEGSLVHIHCSIHHDVEIGAYCELSPGCRILGGATIGSYVSVGAGAIVLPGIMVGDHAVIGAGAVVTKNVAASETVVGVPAKAIER